MADEFMSLTELGKLYGVSRVKMGDVLVQIGLRTWDKKPSYKAFNEGFVEQRDSVNVGTWFYVWNAEKTTRLLDETGYTRVTSPC